MGSRFISNMGFFEPIESKEIAPLTNPSCYKPLQYDPRSFGKQQENL